VVKTLRSFGTILLLSAITCFGNVCSAQSLQTWNGSFNNGKGALSFTMVGTDPSQTNQTTTITAYLVPIKVTFSDNTSFDPGPLVETIVASPVLCGGSAPCTIDFVQGGIDLGVTQYGDAFQRGNFWTTVQPHPGYHVLLQTVVLPEQFVNVSNSDGGTTTFHGMKVGWISEGYFHTYFETILLPNLIQSGQVRADGVVLPVTRDVCKAISTTCQGWGHHGFVQVTGFNPQTYAWFSYVDPSGMTGPQDVDVLSHEVGEWIDDPLDNNPSGCGGGGTLEVGDPLDGAFEGGPPHDYAYNVNGVVYHLQDLVWLPYFGETLVTSAGRQFSFQGESLTVCQNGSARIHHGGPLQARQKRFR
jgi:hypothetical protein